MAFGSTDLLRSIAGGKYFLKAVAQEDSDWALFLADAPDGTPVTVRLVSEDSPVAGNWPDLVAASAAAEHRHLLRYPECGQTRIDGQTYEYLVSEPIEDRVDEVLTERPLTEEEGRAAVDAALTGLDDLHRSGYVHGGVRTSSIVAAGGGIKLLADTVRPMPTLEADARRAVAGDLITLGETVTTLLTREHDPAAASKLPVPFDEVVRVSHGTRECPWPTAAQLRGVLDGEVLAAASAVREDAQEDAPEDVPDVVEERPVVPRMNPAALRSVAGSPVRETKPSMTEPRRIGRPVVFVAAAIAMVVAVAAMLWARRTPAPGPVLSERSRIATAPETGVPQPPPKASRDLSVPETSVPAVVKPRNWVVVAAIYGNYGDAAKRASSLARLSKAMNPVVWPPRGQGKRYFVIAASSDSRKEAERLRARARAAGMPRDTYVTRIQF